jgi:hypothetical protein
MEHLCKPGTGVFVATGFGQKADGKALMEALCARGLTITCDWTTAPPGLSRADMATRDVAGVMRAQVLVALMTLPSYEYKGTFTEIGIAIGAGIPVVLVSPFIQPDDAICARNVYFHLPTIQRYPSVAKLLEAIPIPEADEGIAR